MIQALFMSLFPFFLLVPPPFFLFSPVETVHIPHEV